LAKINLCEWHTLDEKIIKKYRCLKVKSNEEKIFFKNLHNIGYSKISKNNKINVVKAFQRKYRQVLINGKIDKETYLISKNVLKL
jgi:N-acetylmuramoyl-L-alanine amidase